MLCIINYTTKKTENAFGKTGLFIANVKKLSGFTRCMNQKMCVHIGLTVTTLCINNRMLYVRNVII